MEDIKKIQEFFSKPLDEGKQLDQVDFAKVVKAVEQTGHPVTVLFVPKWNEIEVLTGMDAPDNIIRDLSNAVDSLGYGRNDIIIAGDSSNLSRREYSDIFRVNGGHQDYFEESVNENTFKKGDKVTYLGHPAVVTATKEYNGRDFVSVSYDKGTGKTSASMILATSGDVKAVNEMDMNDPVMIRMRAAKMKTSQPTPEKTTNPNYPSNKNAKKLAFLKKERAQLMRDMEQEAEPEGGPIADEYGEKLNKIDAAIAKLKELSGWGGEKDVNISRDEIERRASMIKEENKKKTLKKN